MTTADRAEQRESSREVVLAAAIETLQKVGYNRLRTLDVTKRSGMSEGTLFHYFPTKYHLVGAAFERTIQDMLARGLAEYTALPPPHNLKVSLELLWRALSDERISWTYELFAALKTDPQLRDTIGAALDESSRVLDETSEFIMRQIGRVPEVDASATISVAIWAFQGLVLRDMGRGPSGYVDQLIDFLLHIVDSLYPEPISRDNS